MPAYNAALYIEQAFDSLLAQTFSDWECVVVDDASTDYTPEIIEKYAACDGRIRHLRTPSNSGSAKLPRDIAISSARGEWILALDADDTLASDLLERLVERQRETEADFVVLRLTLTDETGSPTGVTVPGGGFDMTAVMGGREAALLTVGEWVICGNGLIRKSLWLGRKQQSNHMNADEYDTREMLLHSGRVALADAHYYYRFNPSSVSKKVDSKQFESLLTDRMLVGLFTEHFGAASKECRRIETACQRKLLESYMTYARHSSRLDRKGRGEARRLISSMKKQASWRRVAASELPWTNKAVLMLPSAAIFGIANVVRRLR